LTWPGHGTAVRKILMLDILMSTFNGGEFLDEQLDSILVEDAVDLRVLIRDDGSTDRTIDILSGRAEKDGRIRLIKDELGNLGPAASFMKLLEASEADHFMFADQDDVWLRGKIASSLERIVQMAAECSAGTPLIVFTDLTVCDSDLKVVEQSFWKYQRLDPEIALAWKKLLAQNVVTGCTMIGNAAARAVSLPFALPDMMHDHWVAVNAARSGKVAYLPEQTVLYRQHGANAEGAKDFDTKYAAGRLAGIFERYRFYKKAARYFDCSAAGLMFFKIRENLRRLFLGP
jgi:glycosyltransferase involved in cell wall biosynthesis